MVLDDSNYDKVIAGIDPGTNIMGYGIIGVKGKSYALISAGVIQTARADDHYLKLKTIFELVSALIEQYKPDELALEAPFFGKNVQSMLKLGRAQGVAMAAGLSRQIPVFEYSPKMVKQSITGNGNASKEQVAAMLQKILLFEDMPKYLDATDGLGVALCHCFKSGGPVAAQKSSKPAKKKGGWSSFLSENPDRIL